MEQREEIVEDMVFYDNTTTGNVTIRVDEVDEDGTVRMTELQPVRSFGPTGWTWDVEEIDSVTLPKEDIYVLLAKDDWCIESVPMKARS